MSNDTSYLRRGWLTLVAIGVGGFAADYAFNVGLARLLPTHEFGDFRVARAWALLASALVLLGGDRAAPKALAGPLSRGETDSVWAYLRFYFQLSMALSALVIAGTWIGSFLHVGATDRDHHHAMAWLVLSVPINACGALASRSLQSARFPVLAALPWRLGVPLLSLVICLVVAWARPGLTLIAAILASISTVAAITAWQWQELRRRALPSVETGESLRAPRRWLATSVPMMGVFLVTLALSQSDLYFLEMLGDDDEVGLYAAAATVAHFLVMIQTAVVGIVMPLAQPAIAAGPETSRSTKRRAERLMFIGIVPAAILVGLTAAPVLVHFGRDYSAAVPVLELLVVGTTTWALAAVSVLWLQYANQGPTVVAITTATLVVDSALDLLLIPRYGMVGAAASTAVTMTLAAIAVVTIDRRSVGASGRTTPTPPGG